MYEKRPVIENKLLSGRQVLASEPTPSDTSDSDSEYPDSDEILATHAFIQPNLSHVKMRLSHLYCISDCVPSLDSVATYPLSLTKPGNNTQ